MNRPSNRGGAWQQGVLAQSLTSVRRGLSPGGNDPPRRLREASSFKLGATVERIRGRRTRSKRGAFSRFCQEDSKGRLQCFAPYCRRAAEGT